MKKLKEFGRRARTDLYNSFMRTGSQLISQQEYRLAANDFEEAVRFSQTRKEKWEAKQSLMRMNEWLKFSEF